MPGASPLEIARIFGIVCQNRNSRGVVCAIQHGGGVAYAPSPIMVACHGFDLGEDSGLVMLGAHVGHPQW